CLASYLFFFSSRRRHTRSKRDWSSDVCSSDLIEHYAKFFTEEGRSAVIACTASNVEARDAVESLLVALATADKENNDLLVPMNAPYRPGPRKPRAVSIENSNMTVAIERVETQEQVDYVLESQPWRLSRSFQRVTFLVIEPDKTTFLPTNAIADIVRFG